MDDSDSEDLLENKEQLCPNSQGYNQVNTTFGDAKNVERNKKAIDLQKLFKEELESLSKDASQGDSSEFLHILFDKLHEELIDIN